MFGKNTRNTKAYAGIIALNSNGEKTVWEAARTRPKRGKNSRGQNGAKSGGAPETIRHACKEKKKQKKRTDAVEGGGWGTGGLKPGCLSAPGGEGSVVFETKETSKGERLISRRWNAWGKKKRENHGGVRTNAQWPGQGKKKS